MGHMPEWYPYMRAARSLGCRPWELIDQPLCWVAWAIGAEQAENRANEQLDKHRASQQTAFQQYGQP